MAFRKNILPSVRQLFSRKVSKKIFFLHVGKTGGTSIEQAIQNSFGLSESISKRHVFRLNPDASVRGAEITGDKVRDYREKLLLYYMSIERMKYIGGQFFYSEKAMQEFGKEWNFITFLRHPISRWFSHYFYDRYRRNASSSARLIYSDLESFVNSERAIGMGCNYVRNFTEGTSLREASSNEAISHAIENLNKFALVGVLERLDVFTRDYKSMFGAELFIERLNTNPLSKSKQKDLITEEIRQKVEKICQPNMRVYESVLEQIKL